MTDREKAIVMAYTGVCMLSGDKFQIFHKYIEEIMGRPVYTHEMGIKAIVDEIKSRSNADFIALCAEQEPKTGHWIEHPEIKTSTPEYLMFYECSECGDKQCFCKSDIHKKHFCINCGAGLSHRKVRNK